MVIDKKLTDKAARDRFIVLETGVDTAKRKEKMETARMLEKLLVKIQEMNDKIEGMEVEQEGERTLIEDMDEMLVKMSVDYESLEVSADAKKGLKEKIDKMEVEKKERIEKYQTKKQEIKALFKKKEELVNQSNMIELYMAKYH